MRVIAVQTLKKFSGKYPQARQSLLAWNDEAKNARWNNHHELKQQYRTASVINSKRVVFNIQGNNFRLIVDIEYSLKYVFIVWFGPHSDYDKIEVKTIRYVKTH